MYAAAVYKYNSLSARVIVHFYQEATQKAFFLGDAYKKSWRKE